MAGLTTVHVAGPAHAFPGHHPGGEVIPWLDQPAPNPVPQIVPRQLVWAGSGTGVDDGAGALDLTITEQFACSMSVEDALSPDNLLCYEMNGAPLPTDTGSRCG